MESSYKTAKTADFPKESILRGEGSSLGSLRQMLEEAVSS
jgi:hypothetical protein